jgi:hypothetical protein
MIPIVLIYCLLQQGYQERFHLVLVLPFQESKNFGVLDYTYIVANDSIFETTPFVRFSQIINCLGYLIQKQRGN